MSKVENNKYVVYGLNNVTSLLQSKKYDIDKIYIIKDSNAYLNKDLKSKLKNENIVYCDNKTFLNKFSFKHTQGIAAEFKISYLDFTINSSNKNLCYVIIDQMHDPQNLGQIIRTCECAGVDGIILPRHGSVHITDTVQSAPKIESIKKDSKSRETSGKTNSDLATKSGKTSQGKPKAIKTVNKKQKTGEKTAKSEKNKLDYNGVSETKFKTTPNKVSTTKKVPKISASYRIKNKEQTSKVKSKQDTKPKKNTETLPKN